MSWTPLISSSMFNGIYTDVTTCGSALLTIVLAILGFAILYKILSR